MGPWPRAASWPQSLPVFARQQFVHSGALTIITIASNTHLSLAIFQCDIVFFHIHEGGTLHAQIIKREAV